MKTLPSRRPNLWIGARTSATSMTLDGWIDCSLEDDGSDLVLQMDIEGCEYEVLLSASATDTYSKTGVEFDVSRLRPASSIFSWTSVVFIPVRFFTEVSFRSRASSA